MPIARAWERGERFGVKFDPAATVASGIRVPAAVGDFMILDAVRASGGLALSTPEADIPRRMQLAVSREGISLCPETAVCLGALEVLLERGAIHRDERIVNFNTGASLKYPEAVQEALRPPRPRAADPAGSDLKAKEPRSLQVTAPSALPPLQFCSETTAISCHEVEKYSL